MGKITYADKVQGGGTITGRWRDIDANEVKSVVNGLDDTKVEKVTGKGLSTEDYTTAEKTKLAGIATGATANDTDANLKNRANHTGTQTASTISDFAATVRATVLTGLTAAASRVLPADTDSILTAWGKVVKYLTDLGTLAFKSSVDLSGSDATGTLAEARMPALTGDVTSSSGAVATTVGKIQGRTVASTAPTAGQGLVWNNTTSQWEPGTVSSNPYAKSTPSGTSISLAFNSNQITYIRHSTTGNTTYTPSGGSDGDILILVQTIGSAGHTTTFASTTWPGGTTTTPSSIPTTSGKVIEYTLINHNGTYRVTGWTVY